MCGLASEVQQAMGTTNNMLRQHPLKKLEVCFHTLHLSWHVVAQVVMQQLVVASPLVPAEQSTKKDRRIAPTARDDNLFYIVCGTACERQR